MTNTIHHEVCRDYDTDSTASESSQRSEWRHPSSSSVHSAIGKTIRSWIRPLMPPGSVQGEPPFLGRISWDELNKLTGNFGQRSLCGQGTYNQYCRATLRTGEPAAVKKLSELRNQQAFVRIARLFRFSSELPDSDFATQLSKVSRLRHDNFVGLLGYCLESNNIILVHQFARMGSLHDILHGRKGSRPGPVLTWNQRVKIACGAARGLKYLHNEGIVHGGISSRNVLIFDDFVSKIADISLTDRSQDTVILPWHAARVFGHSDPGVDITDAMTHKEDIYRFGVVLLELLTGSQPGDYTSFMRKKSLVTWSAGKVEQRIDPRLNSVYPREAVAKLAAVAAL